MAELLGGTIDDAIDDVPPASSIPHASIVAALSVQLSAILERATANLRAAARADRVGKSWTADDELSIPLENLSVAAKAVSDGATKLVLVLSAKPPYPGAAAVTSICDEFGDRNEELVAALAVVEVAGAAGPLWLEAAQVVAGVVAAAKGLVNTILRQGAGNAEVPRATGVVWEAVEQSKKVPKSNRVAYRRAFMVKSGVVRDTIEEFQAMVDASPSPSSASSSSSSSPAGSAATPQSGDAFDDDFDFADMDGDDEYDAEDLPLATACVESLKLLRPTLKTAMDAMDAAVAGTASSGGGDGKTGLDRNAELWLLCQRVTNAATEFGASLYPPLDVEEVEAAAGPFKSTVREIAAHCAIVADMVEGGEAKVSAQAAGFRKVAAIWETQFAQLDEALSTTP